MVLPAPFGPDHAHALAAVDRDVQIAEQDMVEGLGQIPSLDDDIARAVDLFKAHHRPDDVAHGLDPLAFQLLELPLAVVGLLGALAGAILADVGLELLGLLLLPLGLPLEHLGLLGRGAASTGCSCPGRPSSFPSCSSQILVTTLSRK